MQLTNDNKYDSERRKELRIDEYNSVEHPFMEQLKNLGWTDRNNQVIELSLQQQPSDSFRKSFAEVVLRPKLYDAIRRINPFLTENQLEEVVNHITVWQPGTLLENNERIYKLITEGTSVNRNELTGEQSPIVRYVDFDHPENNTFTAISQFKVNIPGTEHHIIPDIVLFLNSSGRSQVFKSNGSIA